MTTLHALGLTVSHLTPAGKDLITAIKGNSCAWKTRFGWRPKNCGHRDFQRLTGDRLVQLQLAMVQTGKGSPRLVLTAAGEEMARQIQARRKPPRGGQAA